MTFNILYLASSNLYSSSLWKTNTIVFSKLNKLLPWIIIIKLPPPPSDVFKINKPLPGDLKEDLR